MSAGKVFRRAFLRDPVRDTVESFDPAETGFLSGKVRAVKKEVILEERTPISNQGGLGSCVWNAVCDGVETIMPDPVVQLSRLDGYWKDRRQRGLECVDEGTYVRTAFETFTSVGIAKESLWPYVEANVSVRPPLGALLDGVDHIMKLDGYRRIRTDGKQRVLDVKSAVDAGKPVVSGFALGPWWDSVSNADVVHYAPNPNNIDGWHAMLIVGYRVTTSGEVWLKLRNSWGLGWGDSGYAFIDSSYLGDPEVCEDLAVPLLAPKY